VRKGTNPFPTTFFFLPFPSGGPVSGLGRSFVHHGAEGALGIQREPLHFDGHLQ